MQSLGRNLESNFRMAVKEVRNRIPFLMVAGERFRAASEFKLYIPAAILNPPGTAISELIFLSNEQTDIGLLEKPSAPGKAAAIIVNMKAGDEVSLGRSVEVAVDGLQPNAVAFESL